MDMRFFWGVVRYCVLIAVAIGAAYVGMSFSCMSVDSGFMLMRPEINSGQAKLVDRLYTDIRECNVGDVILFEHVADRITATWAGRIVAKPGDKFRTESGVLVVNGSRRSRGSAPALEVHKVPELMVPSGHVLVCYRHPVGAVLQMDRFLIPVSAIRGRVR